MRTTASKTANVIASDDGTAFDSQLQFLSVVIGC